MNKKEQRDSAELVKRYQKILRELVYATDDEIRNSYQEWVDLAEEIQDLRELLDLANTETRWGSDTADLPKLPSTAGRYLDIVFSDGMPECSFVEVESPAGVGARVGTWIDRGDGFFALRLTLADFLSLAKE